MRRIDRLPSSRSASPPSHAGRARGSTAVRRRRVGSLGTDSGVGRAIYEPVYSKWFRYRVGGSREDPVPSGGALLVANHAGAIPSDSRSSCTESRRSSDVPCTGWPTTSSGPFPSSGRSGREQAASRPSRQCVQIAEGAASARTGLPRRNERDLQIVHRPLSTAPLRARRFPLDRRAGRRRRDPHRRRRLGRSDASPSYACRTLATRSGCPTSHHSECARHGSARRRGALPGQVQVARPPSRCNSTFRRTKTGTRRAGSWRNPNASARCSKSPCTTCTRPAQRLVRLRRR